MSTVQETSIDLTLIPGYDPFRDAGDCIFDEDSARLAIDFFPDCLRHWQGVHSGKRFTLEDWQKSVVANLFGWKRPDGTRRYREAFVYIPRKNGKTAFAGGIANKLLFCDGEDGAQIYSAAAEREQAGLVYEQARGQILANPVLASRASIMKTIKRIVYEARRSFYTAIAADDKSAHGFNAHGVIIDELHAMAHKRNFIDALVTCTGARKQPLIIWLTTADFARESFCNEKLDYAEKVRDGVITAPEFLPVIYAASREDDWTDPEVWARANPNLGVSLSHEYIESQCRRAQEVPSFENTFKRLHLNIQTEQAERWIQMDAWDACARETESVGDCYAGLDLASTRDLTAFVLFFPETKSVVPFFWVPQSNAEEREKRDRVPYLGWSSQGLIELTPGNVIDYEYIRHRINEICERFRVREIAYDPYQCEHLAQELQDEDGRTMVKFPQTHGAMNEPTKRLGTLITSRSLRHGGHKVLRWNASNASVEYRGGVDDMVKVSKKNSFEKIDGIVALVMAIGRWLAHGEDGPSVYEDRGLIVLE